MGPPHGRPVGEIEQQDTSTRAEVLILRKVGVHSRASSVGLRLAVADQQLQHQPHRERPMSRNRCQLPYVCDDGGRKAGGWEAIAPGDCATRAWAIALGEDYNEVRLMLMHHVGQWAATSRSKQAKAWRRSPKGRSVRDGTPMPAVRLFAAEAGWLWVPLKRIGDPTTFHLNRETCAVLGTDRFVARVSKHLCAVVDGVVRDTHDPRRVEISGVLHPDRPGVMTTLGGPTRSSRMVYGAWVPGDTYTGTDNPQA